VAPSHGRRVHGLARVGIRRWGGLGRDRDLDGERVLSRYVDRNRSARGMVSARLEFG
jgi:hypothetical protein